MINVSAIIRGVWGSRRMTDPDRDVESGYEGNDVQEETNVTANNTELSLER